MTQFGYASLPSSPAGKKIWRNGQLFALKNEQSADPVKHKKRREETEMLLESAESVRLGEAVRKIDETEKTLARRQRLVNRFEAVFKAIKGSRASISTVKEITTQVCEKHDVSLKWITSQAKHKEAIMARHELFYRLLVETDYSCNAVGRLLCKDHTTVRYGADEYARKNGLPLPRR